MQTLQRPPPAGALPRQAQTAAERDALLADLDDPRAWPAAAAALLADLGFRLVSPERLGDRPWHLLIGLREAPTEQHFDPELVAYYAPAPGGAAMATFDLRAAGAAGATVERAALWGHVHLVDRIPVENRFLTFGGTLRLAATSSRLTVVDLVSPAPIARWGGHSQATDQLSAAIGAFFGRLMVPVNFVAGAAARIDAEPPAVLYRAFLADGLRRAATAEHRGAERDALGAWFAAAWQRARSDSDACDAGQRLLRDLHVE